RTPGKGSGLQHARRVFPEQETMQNVPVASLRKTGDLCTSRTSRAPPQDGQPTRDYISTALLRKRRSRRYQQSNSRVLFLRIGADAVAAPDLVPLLPLASSTPQTEPSWSILPPRDTARLQTGHARL